MFEAQLLVHLGCDLGIVDGKRQNIGMVEHLQFVGQYLDEAGVDLFVFRAIGPDAHLAGDADDALAVEPGGSLEQVGREIAGIKYRLGAALAIADVDEHHPAKVAVGVYPAVESDDLADVFFP